jgi:hypothetical protein
MLACTGTLKIQEVPMFPMLARWLRRAPRPILSPNLAADFAPDLDLAAVAAMSDRPLPRPSLSPLSPLSPASPIVPRRPAPAPGIVLSRSMPTSARQAFPRRLPDAADERLHLQIDPQDPRRVRISGSMREVCAALDALIAVQ